MSEAVKKLLEEFADELSQKASSFRNSDKRKFAQLRASEQKLSDFIDAGDFSAELPAEVLNALVHFEGEDWFELPVMIQTALQDETAEQMDEESSAAEQEVAEIESDPTEEDELVETAEAVEVEDVVVPESSDEQDDPEPASDSKKPPKEVTYSLTDAQRIAELMGEALAAFDDKNYADSEIRLGLLLELDADNKEAQALMNVVEEKLREEREQATISGFRRESERLDDITALDDLHKRIQTALSSDKDNQQLREILANVVAKRDGKREKQRIVTTAGLTGNYTTIVDALKVIDEAIDRGEQTFYDEGTTKIRPIYEVRDELTKLLPVKAKELFDREMKNAKTYLPQNPGGALELLKIAANLEALESDFTDQAAFLLEKTTKDFAKWQRAEKLIHDARQEADLYKKLELLKNAWTEYRDHQDVKFDLDETIERVDGMLNGELTRGLEHAKDALVDERFDDARSQIETVTARVDKYIPEPSEKLTETLERANAFLENLAEERTKRVRIREEIGKIQKAVNDRNLELANNLYQGLPADWKNDKDIRELRAKFDQVITVEEKYKEAQELFNVDDFQTCISVCEEVTDEGPFGQKIQALKISAQIGYHRRLIRENLERQYYDEVIDSLDKLAQLDLEEAQRQDLDDEYASIKNDLNARKKQNQKLVPLEAKINNNLKKGDLRNAFLVLKQAADIQSTRIGKIIEQMNDVGRQLHDEYVDEISALLYTKDEKKRSKISSDDLALAFNRAEFLSQNNLVLSERAKKVRAEAIIGHYRTISADLEEHDAWDEIVNNWERAYTDFSNMLEIRNELREAKRKKLIYDSDQLLLNFKYKECLDQLEASGFDLWEDSDLRLRRESAEVIKEAERLISINEHTAMVTFVKNKNEVYQRIELEKFLTERVRVVITDLIKEGDKLVDQDGRLSEALGKYATALVLDSENVMAQGRLRSRLEEVRLELNAKFVEAENFKYGGEKVDNLIDDANGISRTLQMYLRIVDYIDEKGEDHYSRKIPGYIKKMTGHINELNSVRDVLERYSEGSKSWQNMLRNGVWTSLQNDLNQTIKRILSGNHPEYIELNARLSDASSQRAALEKALDNMQREFSNEDFEAAAASIGEAMKISAFSANENTSDPYGLLNDKAIVFDMDTGMNVRGLKDIRQLIDRQKTDKRDWERWHNELHSALERLYAVIDENIELWAPGTDLEGVESITTVSVNQPTTESVKALETANKLADEAEKKINTPPSEGPMSQAALDAQVSGNILVEELENLIAGIRTFSQKYADSHAFMDLDELKIEIEDLINEHAFIEAMEKIDLGLEYDRYDESLLRFKDICYDYIENGSGGIFGFFKKIFGS